MTLGRKIKTATILTEISLVGYAVADSLARANFGSGITEHLASNYQPFFDFMQNAHLVKDASLEPFRQIAVESYNSLSGMASQLRDSIASGDTEINPITKDIGEYLLDLGNKIKEVKRESLNAVTTPLFNWVEGISAVGGSLINITYFGNKWATGHKRKS